MTGETLHRANSGRKDAAGRTVRVSADVGDQRSSAPTPPVTDEEDGWEPATLAQACAVVRMSAVLPLLGMDADDPETTVADLIATALHWGWANTPNAGAEFDADDVFEVGRSYFVAELDGDDDIANDPSYEDSARDAAEIAELVSQMQTMRTDAAAALAELDAVGARGGWKVVSVDGLGEPGAFPTRLTIARADGQQLVVGYISNHGFDVTNGAGGEVADAWWGDSDDDQLMDDATDAYYSLDGLCDRFGQFGLAQVQQMIDRRG